MISQPTLCTHLCYRKDEYKGTGWGDPKPPWARGKEKI